MDISKFQIANARVTDVRVGTGCHDGRAFFSMRFDDDGGQQSAAPPWDRRTIDAIIATCEAEDLHGCRSKFVRLLRLDKHGPIRGIAHIVEDSKVVMFEAAEVDR